MSIESYQIAERYVRLILAIGQHDPDYVDAFYGDSAWRPTGAPAPFTVLRTEAESIAASLEHRRADFATDALARLRHEYLSRQVAAARARILMLEGARFSFDEEAERLYDVVPPHVETSEFQSALDELDGLLPREPRASSDLADRYAAFREAFVIPADRLEAVFTAAIDECRSRTRGHLTLPDHESFVVEYVTNQPWSAYNWYRGHYQSVIQVNTDLPITIDRAIDLACHEGYPGHHVYNALLERHLVRERGWIEFSIYPLFSPQSLIAEGTANFGIEVAFPGEDRTTFEAEVLYPLVGLDASTAATFTAVQRAVNRLTYAGNEAARRYLDGEIDRDATVAWLERWAMTPRDRAEQRTRFFDRYRSYVVTYNVGQDLVRNYIEGLGGTIDAPDVRWREFGALLQSPRLPSGLRAGEQSSKFKV